MVLAVRVQREPSSARGCERVAYRVRNSIREPHKLNCVLGVAPFRPQSEYEFEGRIVRVGGVVVQRYVPQRIVG